MTRTQILTLRAEGAVNLLLALWIYQTTGMSWGHYAALFLAPDLTFAAYAFGPRAGSVAYNSVHSYIVAGAVLALGHFGELPLLVALGAILWAHIGFDRMLGYGLKTRAGFNTSHLSLTQAQSRP